MHIFKVHFDMAKISHFYRYIYVCIYNISVKLSPDGDNGHGHNSPNCLCVTC